MKRTIAMLLAAVLICSMIPVLGYATPPINTSNPYTVQVTTGYLALRTAKAYDVKNEIGPLYTGETVYVQDTSDATYWYVYSSKLAKFGYVNKNYLVKAGTPVPAPAKGTTLYVQVSDGYLALRNAKAYDSKNEIGELYNGDSVVIEDSSDALYWSVTSSRLGKTGYVNKNYLTSTKPATPGVSTMYVKVTTGYLALRNAKAYDIGNETGKLYTGDVVTVQNTSDATYWVVYSAKLGKTGYVNKNYLVSTPPTVPPAVTMYVQVTKGYLALRNAKAYDSKNEIGELYTGDTVSVTDSSDATYWYVYSPKHGKSGYVNKNYLVSTKPAVPTGVTKTVSVAKGYLALRTAKAYDVKNEIGELYTGDTVIVQDSSDATYWYVYSVKYNAYGYVNKNYLY